MISRIPYFVVSVLFVALTLGAAPADAQQPAAQTSRVTVSFERSTIQDALAFFARYSGRSIVLGTGVSGVVSAQISDQPWDVAMAALLSANGLFARELESGIIVVERAAAPVETPGRVLSRVFRLNYQPAAEIEPVIRSMLTARGTVAVVNSINALVVTDEERVLAQVASVLGQI
jgi:type II secretory pathway component GspD/PulD (secretin)